MLNRLQTLQDQGIQNNQQIMAIVLEMDENEANKQNGVFDKLQEAKKDASRLLQKNDSYMDVSRLLCLNDPLLSSSFLCETNIFVSNN